MGVMLVFSSKIAEFVNTFPGIKMLALVFLVAIGGMLVLESLQVEVEKSYVYFAMLFSTAVELLNIRSRHVIYLRKKATLEKSSKESHPTSL
jgi:predicted tellurium resistance membrane protein TerC